MDKEKGRYLWIYFTDDLPINSSIDTIVVVIRIRLGLKFILTQIGATLVTYAKHGREMTNSNLCLRNDVSGTV